MSQSKKNDLQKHGTFSTLISQQKKQSAYYVKKVMKAKGSTTKSLNDHMKVKHSKEWAKDETNKKGTKSIEKSQPKIESFINKNNKKHKKK